MGEPRKTELLSVKEVAELMRVEPGTVYRWVRLGRMRPLRTPGGQVRFKRGAVLLAMEKYEYGEPGEQKRDPAMG